MLRRLLLTMVVWTALLAVFAQNALALPYFVPGICTDSAGTKLLSDNHLN